VTEADDIGSIIASGYALARIAAQTTGNQAPATQWRALSLLLKEGPRRIGELAAAARATQPGMTRLVTQMVEHELVERREDPIDSRATIISITPAGERALADWKVQLRDALAPLFDDLDADDRAALARTAHLLATRTDLVPAVAR
jgi:DNA-binding MarR family transcriptional regulator